MWGLVFCCAIKLSKLSLGVGRSDEKRWAAGEHFGSGFEKRLKSGIFALSMS
jgi:hypothetical protein